MNHLTSIKSLIQSILRNRELILHMTKRSVVGKYKGSLFGLFWSFLNPLILLTIYTFAFSVVFKAKWGVGEEGFLDFALILFASLTIFNVFGDILKESPMLVLGQPNFVKKVIFPLEILPVVSLLSSLIHAGISIIIFVFFFGLAHKALHLTLLLLPFILLPLIFISLGLSFILASLGVFIRDIGYFMNHIITILLFTSPVFFPLEKVPPSFRNLLYFNPIAYVLEDARSVMVFGNFPNWLNLIIYTFIGVMLTLFGYMWFQKTRKGFADVM